MGWADDMHEAGLTSSHGGLMDGSSLRKSARKITNKENQKNRTRKVKCVTLSTPSKSNNNECYNSCSPISLSKSRNKNKIKCIELAIIKLKETKDAPKQILKVWHKSKDKILVAFTRKKISLIDFKEGRFENKINLNNFKKLKLDPISDNSLDFEESRLKHKHNNIKIIGSPNTVTLEIWDEYRKEKVGDISLHTGNSVHFTNYFFSPDGKYIVTFVYDGIDRNEWSQIYDSESLKHVCNHRHAFPSFSQITRDSKNFLYYNRICRFPDGEIVKKLQESDSTKTSLSHCYYAFDDTAIYAEVNGSVIFWDSQTGDQIRHFESPYECYEVESLIVLPSKFVIACVSDPFWEDKPVNYLVIWDFESGRQVAEINHGIEEVEYISLNKDEDTLVICGTKIIKVFKLYG